MSRALASQMQAHTVHIDRCTHARTLIHNQSSLFSRTSVQLGCLSSWSSLFVRFKYLCSLCEELCLPRVKPKFWACLSKDFTSKIFSILLEYISNRFVAQSRHCRLSSLNDLGFWPWMVSTKERLLPWMNDIQPHLASYTCFLEYISDVVTHCGSAFL